MMATVRTLIRFFGGACALALLLSCETERTVTHTESRMGFGEGWSGQLGDEKKIKEKYASGFEIKDGRAVATGERPNPFEKKEFATGAFQTRDAGDQRKQFATKEFGADQKAFQTRKFDQGAPARETGRRSPWQGRRPAGAEDEFATAEWAGAAKAFDSGAAAPEQGENFRFFGNHGREADLSARARRVEIDTTNPRSIAPGSAASTLSVDDVRKLLNPETFP
jgi:hypothetical protein